MKNKINFDTLINFSKGKYSYNDYLKVKHWFLNEKEDDQTEASLFDQWNELGKSNNEEPLQSIFEKIHYKILLEEKKKVTFWTYYKQVAAILIPIFFISTLAYFLLSSDRILTREWVEINVPEGTRTEFMLPDSTFGWLNSGAKLRYSPKFTKHRKVKLVGEAFFNVKHVDHSDFTVCVPDLNIRVLGTQFNVAAYNDELTSEVTLKEGKVEVMGKQVKFKQELMPGEQIVFDHQHKTLTINKVEPSKYMAWTDGFLVIDNEPLRDAVKKIERWYNAEIVIQDEALKNFRFKATFAGEPLEEVLKLIAMTTPVDYEIEKRKIDQNGILKKKHITIMLK